ncbi:MAG: PEGA domain-containing protein [Fibrobacter sp.]|nr:PEGA domain-containing protein [Fibrobacter sp.]
MKEMFDKDTWFEAGLKESINTPIDFQSVEERLFARIAQTEDLGELSILKIEETLSADKLQLIEKNLFSGIAQYKEYEEPVNECIKAQNELSLAQWERLEAKLDERIDFVDSLESWEQVILAPEEEPLSGTWDQLEERLCEQMNKIEPQELWVQCAKKEEIITPAIIEKAEQLLDERLNHKAELNTWEQVLRADEVLTCRQWDEIESNLFDRLDSSNGNSELAKQPFWIFINHYLYVLKTVGVVAAALLLAVFGVTGFLRYTNPVKNIPTFVYQIQGESLNMHQLTDAVGHNVNSADNGAVTLINKHGSVELQNGSSLEISKISEKNVHYKVHFKTSADRGVSNGKIAFLVNPHKSKDFFKVNTPDYQISVKGTYFQIEPDKSGHISTRVLEGAVKITSGAFGDTLLKAGQSIIFDNASNQYRIHSGGPVVQRKEIEQVPEVDEIVKYGIIKVKTPQPGAEVKIDGKYCGSTPIAIRQAPGVHHITVSRQGYNTLDTTVVISADHSLFDLAAVLEPEEKNGADSKRVSEVAVNSSVHKTENVVVAKSDTVSPESVAVQLLGQDNSAQKETERIYLEAQKAEFSGKWQLAIELYQKVFNHQGTSKLRREDALFSIGILKAAHERDASGARQVFLTYLALYPNGSFAGETWLRLAELEFKNDPEKAVQYYIKFFEMFPHHPRASELQNRVGVIYLQMKRYDEAVKMFKLALTSTGTGDLKQSRGIAENLHRALLLIGDQKNADTIWNLYLVGTR